jgi:hypothetical protein
MYCLCRILDLPRGTNFYSLLSAKSLKGPETSSRRVGRLGHVGPSKIFEGRHGDGQPLSLVFQVRLTGVKVISLIIASALLFIPRAYDTIITSVDVLAR